MKLKFLNIVGVAVCVFLSVAPTVHAQEALSQSDLVRLISNAEKGDNQAEFALGVAYATGTAGPVDYTKALLWLQKSADAGNIYAQADLGSMYVSGMGVTKNNETAFAFFQKAAIGGLAKAQDNMGYMYATGMGVAQNYNLAYVWYDLASRNGMPEDAQMRDQALMHIRVVDIDAVHKLAQSLDPHKPVFP